LQIRRNIMTNAAKKFVRRLIRMTLRDLLVIGLPLVILIVAGFWATYQFVQPAPPKRLVITTGAPEGSYQSFATRYKEVFARNGIELEIRPSAGAVENLELLLDRRQTVDVGFVQNGVADGKDTTGLTSLGMMYPEPMWLFYKGKDGLDTLDKLKGMRIAVGQEGSGTRLLALSLLEAHGLAAPPTQISDLSGMSAAQALERGEVDAVFLVGAAQSGTIWTLLYTPGVHLFSFSQAEAYARRFPQLTVLTLPRGAIDLQRDLPRRDIKLIAPTAALVARESTHPALVDLLLQAATEVHSGAGLFQRAGEFPAPNGGDIPLSKDAERYYKSGKPFLQHYLPFWAATLINRLIILAVPVFALLIPLIKVAPSLYSWRVRMRVFRYYGELKLLELQAQDAPKSKTPEEWIAALDRIEQAAHRIPTPNAFAEQVYTLRANVNMVREATLRRLTGTSADGIQPAVASDA
jgi:TRAP transporter TAXI family solute receptor